MERPAALRRNLGGVCGLRPRGVAGAPDAATLPRLHRVADQPPERARLLGRAAPRPGRSRVRALARAIRARIGGARGWPRRRARRGHLAAAGGLAGPEAPRERAAAADHLEYVGAGGVVHRAGADDRST